jgi:hypothetical protein
MIKPVRNGFSNTSIPPVSDVRTAAQRGQTRLKFRTTRRSQLTVYRCRDCQGVYNLYSGTIFAACHLRPAQVVLLVRGVLKGESAATLARELGMSRTTLTELRHLIQQNAAAIQPQTALKDNAVETDELFQNAGEKRHGAC